MMTVFDKNQSREIMSEAHYHAKQARNIDAALGNEVKPYGEYFKVALKHAHFMRSSQVVRFSMNHLADLRIADSVDRTESRKYFDNWVAGISRSPLTPIGKTCLVNAVDTMRDLDGETLNKVYGGAHYALVFVVNFAQTMFYACQERGIGWSEFFAYSLIEDYLDFYKACYDGDQDALNKAFALNDSRELFYLNACYGSWINARLDGRF